MSALALALALGLSACNNVETPDMPDFMKAKNMGNVSKLDLPGSYLGSGDRAPRSASEKAAAAAAAAKPLDEAEVRKAFEGRGREAAALWKRAEAAKGNEAKADLYEELADDYAEYPRAAEARYRQGLHLYRAGEWRDATTALQTYVSIVPVNPHLPEVEEMIYRSALKTLASRGGLFGLFKNDEDGLEALRYVATTFPAGDYPDDALLALGRHYQEDAEELQRSMLYFKELLQRYPDSEWSFEARRALGDTYALRDQGSAYHAGFVDRDPREEVPDDPAAEAAAGAVRSSVEMALEEYDKYIERIELDPARRAEYAKEVEAVTRRQRGLREELARKDDRVAAYYAARGEHKAAAVYRRSAAQLRGQKVASLRRVTGCEMPRSPAAQPEPDPVSPGTVNPGTVNPGTVNPGTLTPLPASPAAPAPATPSRPTMPAQPPMPAMPPQPALPTRPTQPAPPPMGTRASLPARRAGAPGHVPPPPPPPSWPPGR